MRIFYKDEGPIDTLLQVAAKPVQAGDLISSECVCNFVKMGWVVRCEGWYIMTAAGHNVVNGLKLCRTEYNVTFTPPGLLGHVGFVGKELPPQQEQARHVDVDTPFYLR